MRVERDETIARLICQLFAYREQTAVVRAGKVARYRIQAEIDADDPASSLDLDALRALYNLLLNS